MARYFSLPVIISQDMLVGEGLASVGGVHGLLF